MPLSLPFPEPGPDVEVEVIVRVDHHRLTFRADRRRVGPANGTTADAVRRAIDEAGIAATEFVARAYGGPS